MSKEAVDQFLAAMKKDKALQGRLETDAGKSHDVMGPILKAAKGMGYDFTAEEFLKTQDELQGQLSDEQLEAIAGGKIPQGQRIVKWTFNW